ncbi:MAG: hypothetical protein WCK57_08915 [Verrucomicrobiae bacterium]
MQPSGIHPFIHRMALRNAVNAAFQRVPIYAVGVKYSQHNQLRETAKQWLALLGCRYFAWEYDCVKYCSEITSLRKYLISKNGAILRSGQPTIGVCQKLISLYLKYLWLYGDSAKKPVFPPLDRQILQKTNAPGKKSFPQIIDINEYQDICNHIDAYAKNKGYGSGVVWEADNWTDKQDDD